MSGLTLPNPKPFLFRGVYLLAIPSYIQATPEERSKVCNGCGTAGWKGKLVPETMWGLDISEACQIHDWDYKYGKTEADKEAADLRLMANLIRIINHRGGFLAPLRRYRATTYYNAVAEAGGAAFYDGKTCRA